MDPVGQISSYRALVDTSSVVAHDLCAQLHVLQFCLDELEHHIDDSGKEYLDRMGVSTNYIAELVNSFRRQLKISISDDGPENLEKVVNSACELVKNHFFIVIEKLELIFGSDLNSFTLKNNGRKLMLMMFSIYATFIEDFKERDMGEFSDNDKLSISINSHSENSRFVKVSMRVKNTKINKDSFEEILQRSAPEKGKIRKFVGLNLVEEYRKENPEWFNFSSLENGAEVEFTLPLQI